MTTTDFAPIAGQAVWRAVMQAAGYRCQCTGGCKPEGAHKKEAGGRCKREHKPWLHLVAAAADPTGNPHNDMAGELVAYCPTCFVGHKTETARAAKAFAKANPFDTPLFDLGGEA